MNITPQVALAGAPLRTLVEALVILDPADRFDAAEMTEDERHARVDLIDEIERRVPGVDSYLDASFGDEDDHRTYSQRLIAALKSEGAL